LPSRILVPRRQGNGNEGETGSGDVRKAAGEADNTGRPAKEVGLLPSVSLVLTSSSETVQMRQSVSSATMIRTIRRRKRETFAFQSSGCRRIVRRDRLCPPLLRRDLHRRRRGQD